MKGYVPERESVEAIVCAMVIGLAAGVGMALIYLGWVGLMS